MPIENNTPITRPKEDPNDRPITREKFTNTGRGEAPLEAMRAMKGRKDISRHERAEEAIRQHFRDLNSDIEEKSKVDKKL